MNHKSILSHIISRALIALSLVATQTIHIHAVSNPSLTGKSGTIATTLKSLKALPASDQYAQALDLLASGALVQQATSVIGKAITDSPKLTKTFTHMKQLLSVADTIINNKNTLSSAHVKQFTNTIALLDTDKKALSNEYYLLDADKRTAKNIFYELMPLLLQINTILVAQTEKNKLASTTPFTSMSTESTSTKPSSVPVVAAKPTTTKPTQTTSDKPTLDIEAQKTQLSYELQTIGTALNRNLVNIQDGKKIDFKQLQNELNQWKTLTKTPKNSLLIFIEQYAPANIRTLINQYTEINNTLITHIQNIIDFKLEPSFDINEEEENNAKNALLATIESKKPEESIRKAKPKSFKTKAEEAAYSLALAFGAQLKTLVESIALIREFPE